MGFLFGSIGVYLIQNFSNKMFAKKHKGPLAILQNEMCVIFAVLSLLAVGSFRLIPFDCLTYTAIYGVVYFLTIYSLLRAMELGSLGMASLICNLGNMLGTLFGIFRFGDRYSFFTVIGILLMVGVVVLSAPISKQEKSKGVLWFVFALLSALGNGVLGSLKLYATRYFTDVSNGEFLLWSFLFASVTGAIILVAEMLKGTDYKVCFKTPVYTLLSGVSAGVGTAFGNLLFMVAIGTGLSSAIVFPVNSGVLSFLLFGMSWLVFKEVKPTVKNVIALCSCVLGMILIRL